MIFKPYLKENGFDFGDDLDDFKSWAKEHVGEQVAIELFLDESWKQRRFFEGAIVRLCTYYQDNLDYRDWRDVVKCREWLMQEFNGEDVAIGGRIKRISKSSKGLLNKGLMERILDWMADQGYQVEILNPKEYKKWRDEIYPSSSPSDPANYIDYLLSLRQLKPRVESPYMRPLTPIQREKIKV